MKLSQFEYHLPQELIASHPTDMRGDARMMVIDRKNGTITHRQFSDLLEYFDEGDVMVMNDTKVIPSHLYGLKEKTGAQIDVFLLRELNAESMIWDVIVEPARKIRMGNKLYFGEDNSMVAEVIDNTTARGRTLRFLYDGPHDEFLRQLYSLGTTPIPAYLNRKSDETDVERYQTIYAANEGAVVAPAAGLHFTPQMLKRMEIRGIEQAFVTVHCGLGAYREIEVEDLSKHRMDSERIEVSPATADLVNRTKDAGHRVAAIGSSALRAIATAATMGSHIQTYTGWTNKFIFPPYDFTVTSALLTTLHLPLSTMLMTACAFGGYDLVMRAYEEAKQQGYAFGAYGDLMLII